MECLDAQKAISEALDHEQVETTLLEDAKEHCRSCSECATFVRALSLAKRAPLPTPTDDLAGRVMASVRAEAEREAAEVSAAAAAEAELSAAEAPSSLAGAEAGGEEAEYAPLAPAPRARRVSRRTMYAAWSAAAAVFVAGVIMLTMSAIRDLSAPPRVTSTAESLRTNAELSASVPQAANKAAVPSSRSSASGSASVIASAPAYITIEGAAYRLSGTEGSVTVGTLVTMGQTTSALDGTAELPRTVLRGADTSRVYIQADPSTLLAFDRVTRQYQGKTYALTSSSVKKFGEWPTLPGTIAEPTSSNGAPTFTVTGSDTSGVTIYRLNGDTTGSGIAVAPGTSASDPAGGNPNWTWWTLQ